MRKWFLVLVAMACMPAQADRAGDIRQCENAASGMVPGRERSAFMRSCVSQAIPKPRRFPGGLVEGMGKDEVLHSEWGAPHEAKTIATPSGNVQEWTYARGRLYFDASGRLANAK